MKDKIMNNLLVIATKIQNQKYMTAIKNAFTKMLPIIIVGSFCTLFTNVLCSTKEGALSVANIPGMDWLSSLSVIFDSVNYATMNLFAFFAAIIISYELCTYYGYKEKLMCAAISLASYVALCATVVSVSLESGETLQVVDVLSKTYTGVQGLFLAMIVSVIATELYIKISKIEKLKIHMPESVPSNIANAFNALAPAFITMISIAALANIFHMCTNITLFDAINMFIQKPLTGILTGLPGYLFIFFISTLLWFFGIHGTQVLKPIYQATLMAAVIENADNLANGLPAVNILNEGFRTCFTIMGGAGCTLGLILAVLIFSKRDDYRSIIKLAIPCSIFNINEPIIFGMPIVLNPILGIPFMLAPIVTGILGYIFTKIGLATVLSVITPFTTPIGINAFLNSNGHIGTVIAQLLCLIAAFLVYVPFILATNKMDTSKQK